MDLVPKAWFPPPCDADEEDVGVGDKVMTMWSFS